jgi:hypothetical protein
MTILAALGTVLALCQNGGNAVAVLLAVSFTVIGVTALVVICTRGATPTERIAIIDALTRLLTAVLHRQS